MMETDGSCSGDSNSSSATSSDSSEAEEEVLEPVRILGHTIELPQELCEDYGIFKEFFSMKPWESLEDKHKEHLMKFLPKFPENDEEEKEKTVKMLFNREPFHFTSPLNDFYSNLRHGNYRPDIAKMKKFLLKARAKQQKHKIKSYYAKLLPEVLLSRERLLTVARAAPPGPPPCIPPLPPKPSARNNYRSPQVRARQRYFEELAAIRAEVGGEQSEDENYSEGPPMPPSRKRPRTGAGQSADANVSGTLGIHAPTSLNSMECLKKLLAAHKARRRYRDNHPELNVAGITLEDIRQRVALVNGTKKLMFGGPKAHDTPNPKARRPKKEKQTKISDSKPTAKVKDETETPENRPLLPNIKIKCEREESDSEHSSYVDPVASPRGQKRQKSPEVVVKQEIVDLKYPDSTNFKYVDPSVECVVKQEPQDPTVQNSKLYQPVPIKLEDLDGIDMMALPIDLADDCGALAPAPAPAAAADPDPPPDAPHSSFLCVVRALFPARHAHRASKQQLRSRCAAVVRSPRAQLNPWYHLSSDWCAELDSALDFLAGERGPHPDDFVPYLQFIPETQMYQWIGAGRDGDAILNRLCDRWLRAASPLPPPNELPMPRYPTSWVVRAPTNAEVMEFRAQERKRFAAVARPFTYIQHGYRSVVGPCARAAACSAHAALLSAARPRHVTFTALVRDAVARLPNGEGSRHDVLTLLKMSQYVSTSNDQMLLSAASSTLDRLHSAKRDPMVKFDQRSAVWTYLHRNRSEEDWLKNKSHARQKTVPAPAPAPAPAPPRDARSATPPAMDMEVAVEEVVENASDSDVDVDVDDCSTQLSSAQLLRQATLAQPPAAPPKHRPKPPSPPKHKPTPKTPTPVTPKPVVSPKNSAAKALAQSVKQAVAIAKQAHLAEKAQSKQLAAQNKQLAAQNKQLAAQAKQAAAQAKQAAALAKSAAQAKPAATKPVQAKPLQGFQLSPAPSPTCHKSPLLKQRPLQRTPTEPRPPPKPQPPPPSAVVEPLQVASAVKPEPATIPPVQPPPPPAPAPAPAPTPAPAPAQQLHKQHVQQLTQVSRSLLLRPSVATTALQTAAAPALTTQMAANPRRGVVRVLSPAAPPAGKSLISPRALMSQGTQGVPTTTVPVATKRPPVQNAPALMTLAQSTTPTAVVSSTPTIATSLPTRTVQLAGGRTIQLAANQTVHLPGGQSVQLASGHTLQLSALQLPTHSVRLPSGQTVQLASPQTVRNFTAAKSNSRPHNPAIVKNAPSIQTSHALQIPVSTVQIGGQTVQIAGHTVKLPSGQSVQLAGQMPTQVQLPSGQTVQLSAGQNIQTVHLNQQSGQAGQTMQIGGHTVQLPSGQTLQLSGQTVQLSSGQTLQLSGQTVQLAGQQQKLQQVVRSQTPADKSAQPIVAKLLTNAQGQMISLEGMLGRTLQLGARHKLPASRAAVPAATRPLILSNAKPLHNIFLQHSDGSAVRVSTSGGVNTSQAIVLSNLGHSQAITTPTVSSPVVKLQQTSTVPTSGGAVRSVLLDGQQLKLVGGRHVLARLLRPNLPPQ